MIFTIGREDISVWETFKDAQWHINKNELYDEYKVYGVDADWENDTEIMEGERWRSLKRDAKLIKIVLLSTVFPWVKSES